MGRSSGGGGRSAGAAATGSGGGAITQSSVEQSYNRLQSGGDDRVAIADIKDDLGASSNTELHSTLREMQQSGLISLRGIEDPQEITARMRAAAIDNGRDDFAPGGRDLRPFVIFR